MPLPLLALGATLGRTVLGLPAWMKVAAGSVLLIGVLQFLHWREDRQFQRDLGEMTQRWEREVKTRLAAELALSEVTANRDHLAGEVRRQNDAIVALEQARTAEQRAAALAAVRALQKGREEAAALRAPTSTVPPGDAAMNAWLAERVTP